VARERGRHRGRVLDPEPRASLDVREEEGHDPRREAFGTGRS
jgi:hypothetical protein